MRVVVSCSLGGGGHLLPVLGAARALAASGHEPTLLVPPVLADRAAESGLPVAVGDQPPAAQLDAIWDRVRAGPPDAVAGLIDREVFAGSAADAMATAAMRLCRDTDPAFVLRESCEYASAFAAHRLGIPHAQVGISQARIEHGVLAMVAARLDRRAAGVSDAIAAAPYLTAFPAPLDPSRWADTRRYRAPAVDPRPLGDWWPGDERPLVYVTFGTVLGHLPEAARVLRTVLSALGELPVRALLTVGGALDPGSPTVIPANVRVEPWVDQADAFAAARLVVCHGGSGTVFGALAAGLPVVACPLFADQGANAQLVAGAGAGLVVTSGRAPSGGVGALHDEDVPALREAIGEALGRGDLRAGARRIAAEMTMTPTFGVVLDRTIAGRSG